MSRNVFAEVDAWKSAREVPRAEKRRALGFAGWRAIVEMPVPTTAPRRERFGWLRLAVRFRVHANDDRVWLVRPCFHVPGKWRSLMKWEPPRLAMQLLAEFGWERGVEPPAVELARARGVVRALMVERDTWLEQGGAVRHTMRPFRWEDFG